MSRVYFSTKSGAGAELYGSERAHCAVLSEDIFFAAVGIHLLSSQDPIWRLIDDPDAYRYKEDRDGLQNYLTYRRYERSITIDGEAEEIWSMMLNTAWALGNLPLQLMATVHAQCEIHGYMEGEDRAWIASIIRDGRRLGIMRPNMGWEEVVTLLEAGMDEPVVTSYSVTDTFPSYSLVHPSLAHGDYDVTESFQQWEDLSSDERWDQGIEALRNQDKSMRWKQEGWDDRWFGTASKRLTGFDLRRAAQEIEENTPGTSYGRIYTKAPVPA